MKIYPEKGHALNEAERLELGRLLLKAGYLVHVGKEKIGNTAQWFLEFYRKIEFGQEKAAPGSSSPRSGGADNDANTITQ